MKREFLTGLAALSLLVAAVSTHGSYFGPGYGGYRGNGYGYPAYGGYGPSIVRPAYVNNPWGYGYDVYGDDDWFDDWSGLPLPPPAPNPTGPSKTIEIPPQPAQHHG